MSASVLDTFVSEVAQEMVQEQKKSSVKTFDIVIITELILTIVTFIFNWWKSRHATTSQIKKEASSMNLVQRMLIKFAVKQYLRKQGKDSSISDEVVKKVLSKVAASDDTKVVSLQQVILSRGDFPL